MPPARWRTKLRKLAQHPDDPDGPSGEGAEGDLPGAGEPLAPPHCWSWRIWRVCAGATVTARIMRPGLAVHRAIAGARQGGAATQVIDYPTASGASASMSVATSMITGRLAARP